MKIVYFFAVAICVASALPQKQAEEDLQVSAPIHTAQAKTPFYEDKCDTTGVVCRLDCIGIVSGQFQFCGNCSTFLVCDQYVTHYGHCPGDLRWDDQVKRCSEVSETCEECYIPPLCPTTGPSCTHNDCTGLNNGPNQICDNCTSYVVCEGEQLVSMQHCPEGLFWHNLEPKGCVAESQTCVECFDLAYCNTTGPSCISSCEQVEEDGIYQSCDNCVQFIQCASGFGDHMYCPLGTYYDDNRQGCIETSSTCLHCADPDVCESTGEDCVRRCVGVEDGFYQACTNCTSYVQCNNNAIYYQACEPAHWVWDGSVSACLPSSNTCEECYT
ncbi:hypothetical protein CAPTEDRAFT_212380 [Capitella teleta]|uniref:Chitin-binding type-2 domain-containing protein n=1 Tax=Capitella teleta TaxID=283909 RepID=R7UXR1_CAPTE|nr:hypothetical protein CAPTEDRAFT_212380 [Capitella teleta]|eukprot:ELU08717.1 hypothetical protein CAPTEDRAFT_212380 [Capitella teleta]